MACIPLSRLRRLPLLSNRSAIREGGHHQRGGAALARWPLGWRVPVLRFEPTTESLE